MNINNTSITEIGDIDKEYFRANKDIEKVTLINTQIIDEYAFAQCIFLKEINLPESLRVINDGAFRDCIDLKKIHLPENLKRIGSNAFDTCVALTEINIPDNIENIEFFAFSNCKNLKTINYKGINILDFIKEFSGDITTLRAVYEIATGNTLNDEEKKSFLELQHKKINIYSVLNDFLNKKEFLNNVLDGKQIPKLFDYFSNKSINSKELWEIIKDKPFDKNTQKINYDISKIKNHDLLLKCFPSREIISNIYKIDESIRYNKDFLLKLFKEDNNLDTRTDFRTVPFDILEFFKNNEEIVGEFAARFPYWDSGELEDFLSCIDIDIEDLANADKEKLCWLATNNINFTRCLTEDEKNIFLINTCCSFDNIEFEKCEYSENSYYEHYKLNSIFNDINISITEEYIKIYIEDKFCNDREFIIKSTDKFYTDLFDALHVAIEEYEKEKELER